MFRNRRALPKTRLLLEDRAMKHSENYSAEVRERVIQMVRE